MIVKESKKMKEALHDDELSDLIDDLQLVLDHLDVENSDSDSDALNELCKSLSRSIKMLIDYGFNKAKKVLEDLDIIADSLSELGFDYYAEQIWDIVAPLRQDSFNESKKEDKKMNRRSLKESLDVTDVESIYRYIKGNFSGSAEYHDLTTREDLFNFVCDKLADYFGKDIYYDNEQSITDVVDWLWDEKEQESSHYGRSYNESKKRKVIGKVSMKEAKKALKEDAADRIIAYPESLIWS